MPDKRNLNEKDATLAGLRVKTNAGTHLGDQLTGNRKPECCAPPPTEARPLTLSAPVAFSEQRGEKATCVARIVRIMVHSKSS